MQDFNILEFMDLVLFEGNMNASPIQNNDKVGGCFKE